MELNSKGKKCYHLDQKSTWGKLWEGKASKLVLLTPWTCETTHIYLRSWKILWVCFHRSFIKDFSKLHLLYMNLQENSFTMRRKAWTFLRVLKVHKWVLQSYPFQWKRESSILIPTLRTLPKGLNYNKLKMMFNCVLHIFTLTREQKKYCTTREESLAVVLFTCYFSHYLLGRPFDIRTDHSSLQ